jgi:hypothetical protein
MVKQKSIWQQAKAHRTEALVQTLRIAQHK